MEPIRALLCGLGLSNEDSFEPFYPRTRDRQDVAVLRCRKSGVIVLSRSDHVSTQYYEQLEAFKYWDASDRRKAELFGYEDEQRRQAQLTPFVLGKKWLDIGTGTGALLNRLSPVVGELVAVEPQPEARAALAAAGYRVYRSVADVPDTDCDVVTLFHVLEHLDDPVTVLATARSKMKPGGKLIVEVPHARDFLIDFLSVEAFKAFTFWSEHLILHTRDSLRTFLAAGGFSQIVLSGHQRFSLANHLYWLARGKPGGHVEWAILRSPSIDQSYGELLSRLDHTDTLIAVASS